MKRWFGVWLVVFAVHAAIGMATGALLLRGGPAPPPGSFGGALLAGALVTMLATVLAARLEGRGPGRALVLFALPFGVQANNLVELMLFPLDIEIRTLPAMYLHLLLGYAVMAVLLDAIAPAGASEPHRGFARRGVAGWLGRVAGCDLGYVVTYFTAGMIVFPFVRPFYESQTMPPVVALLQLQLLRGLVLTGLLLLLTSRLRASRRGAVLFGGLALSVFGASPLLIPTGHFPDYARLAHLAEVGLSNFVYGCAVAFVLTAGGSTSTSTASDAVPPVHSGEGMGSVPWR